MIRHLPMVLLSLGVSALTPLHAEAASDHAGLQVSANALTSSTELPVPRWRRLSSTPCCLRWFSAVHDPVRDRVIVYEGSKVWAFSDREGPTWTQLDPIGPQPPLRSWHVAAYDPAHDQMVVFGGTASDEYGQHVPLNDVWALSLSGTPEWVQPFPPSTEPGRRFACAAIYDPVRERLIVHGGVFENWTGRRYAYGDTWALILSDDTQWSMIATADDVYRSFNTAVYDPVRDRMLMFGGSCTHECFNDSTIFALSLAESEPWSELTVEPAPIAGQSDVPAVYDETLDAVVAFGTVSSGDLVSSGLWLLSLSGTVRWEQLEKTYPWPASRYALVRDTPRRRILMLSEDEVWELKWDGQDTEPPVAVGMAVIDVQAESDLVRLDWFSGEAIETAIVVRSEDSLSWRDIGAIEQRSTGHLVFEDRDVVAGKRYGYRVRIVQGDREDLLGEVWVEVPLPPMPTPPMPTLAIRSARWSQEARGIAMTIALPNAQPATLELLDLAGRKVASTELDRGAGEHDLLLDTPGNLASGLYLLRLRQGGAFTSSKVQVVR